VTKIALDQMIMHLKSEHWGKRKKSNLYTLAVYVRRHTVSFCPDRSRSRNNDFASPFVGLTNSFWKVGSNQPQRRSSVERQKHGCWCRWRRSRLECSDLRTKLKRKLSNLNNKYISELHLTAIDRTRAFQILVNNLPNVWKRATKRMTWTQERNSRFV